MLLFAAAFAATALAMWGFTVDDALISIRYARHLAEGAGYRFDVPGPATDGVTPLPWPFVLVPLAGAPAWSVLVRAKALGVVLHAGAGALVGAQARRSSRAGRLGALAAVFACLPLAAWGAAGMETPLATLLAASCVFYMDRPLLAALFAGLAAAVRPELLPWAATLACGLALANKSRPGAVLAAALVAAAPFSACAIARRVAFGHFAPLAVLAKPSDLAHGALYATAALVACALPILALAPLALRALPGTSRAVAAAFAVHVLAVIAAGGDSMPYARLFVPVLPSLLVLHLQIARVSKPWAVWLRTGVTLAVGAWFVVVAAPRGRRVMRERAELVRRATPVLAGAKSIAAVDVGWVSAASEARIVDLAGLTDPEIAALRGGHTSKRVSGAMLLDRDVDTIVLYANPLETEQWGHVVAARLARDPLVAEHFVRASTLPLGETAGYVVFRRVR